MSKVSVNGKVYDLIPTRLNYYDLYLYGGILSKNEPLGTYIIGYVVIGRTKVAVCKKAVKKFVILSGFVGFLLLCGTVLLVLMTRKPVQEVGEKISDHDLISETATLDDGVRSATRKFSYSYYTTYDGTCVSVVMGGYDTGGLVAVRCGDFISEWYPQNKAVMIPVKLDISEEGVLDAHLLVKSRERISEYPLVIEMMEHYDKVELAEGSVYDHDVAERNAIERHDDTLVNETKPEDYKRGSLSISAIKTDEDVRVDFENFDVISIKR